MVFQAIDMHAYVLMVDGVSVLEFFMRLNLSAAFLPLVFAFLF